MRKWLLAGVFALTACGAKINDAKEIAAHNLNDPSSAQFREVKAAGEHCVTGEINAKNRVGAYTGFREFIVDMRKREVAIVADPPIGDARTNDVIADTRVAIFAQDCGLPEGPAK